MLVFFVFFCFLTSCASGSAQFLRQPEKVERYNPFEDYPLASGASLLNFKEYKVIDDFNGAQLTNRMASDWKVDATAGGKLNLQIEKADALRQRRGYSLKITYQLESGEEAAFQSSLGNLDISGAEYLVFKCRIANNRSSNFSGRLRVFLMDANQRSVIYDMTHSCLANPSDWSDVVIPIKTFGRLDLNQLTMIGLKIKSRKMPIKGSLNLDEIAFFGSGDVDFESRRDNLVGFPEHINPRRLDRLRQQRNTKRFLMQIAQDTWKYFVNARDKETHLVVDHLRIGERPLVADYTSPTNIAMDYLATVAAWELGFISREEAITRIRESFHTLGKLRRWKGFFYNFYHTRSLAVSRDFVSSVDNGWLAIALVVVRQAFADELAREATAFLDAFDFGEFLDPQNNQLTIGYDGERGKLLSYHYGMLASEARATSLYGIGKGDLPREHWWFIYRTPPERWGWQRQKPHGEYVSRDGVEYFQGYYTYLDKKFVPSWGGSLFEFLMPTLVIRERELAPHGLGLNNRIVTELHRDYCLKIKKYPLWGISPAGVSNGHQWRYAEMGIPDLGVKGYPDLEIITPHASFLALDVLPEDALTNIRNFMKYDLYGKYGFYDSINLRTEEVNPQYLALDQGMILVSICNYLKSGVIQKLFHQDPVGENIEDLLAKESFFNT